MTSQGRRFLLVYLLVLAIMGTGILCTYQVMQETLAWPAPALLSLQSNEEQWELAVLGLQYYVNKEEIEPAHLKAETLMLAKQLATWAEPIRQKGFELLQDASNLVLDRLTGE